MRCPLCDVSMKEVERRGIEIDICPECRGVWLDRGELEKLLEVEEGSRREENLRREDHYARDRLREREYDYRKDDDFPGRKKKKRRSLLGEIFDSLGGD